MSTVRVPLKALLLSFLITIPIGIGSGLQYINIRHFYLNRIDYLAISDFCGTVLWVMITFVAILTIAAFVEMKRLTAVAAVVSIALGPGLFVLTAVIQDNAIQSGIARERIVSDLHMVWIDHAGKFLILMSMFVVNTVAAIYLKRPSPHGADAAGGGLSANSEPERGVPIPFETRKSVNLVSSANHSVEMPVADPARIGAICQSCGTSNDSDARFCTRCGGRIEANPQE